MTIPNFIIAYFIYLAIEILVRVGILACRVGVRHISWGLMAPSLMMISSPGYWVANNCKLAVPTSDKSRLVRAGLIKNFNLWNVVLSFSLLLTALTIRLAGYPVAEIVICVLAWRFISRSVEIAVAFAVDITTSSSLSALSNTDRMKLALRSYFEIFIYSAAFYAASEKFFEGVTRPLLDSLYVGTLTNVASVAERFAFGQLWVFIQIFATLSLVLLSIAGYLGKIKEASEESKT